MPLVRVDLQEGFADDRVSVRLNGVTAVESDHVSTRTQVSVAAVGQERELPAGRLEVVVDVPSRNLTGRLELPLSADTYVGVSVEDGRISFRQSNEAFGYL
jgi:hypothetical protein